MKAYLLIMALVLQMMGISYAQEMGTVEEMAAQQTALMDDKLSLSGEQKIQVETINRLYTQKQVDLMNSSGSMFFKVGDMKEIGRSKAEALKAVLTEEQMKIYEDEVIPILKKQMKKKRKS
ncbi:hypothetical protein POV27_12215 [Aureisphaera galaxeae]|uniref:hypothetical protein n=1 Tax=Aureisphaera galaxeae TaxID=1538023 RepID=UPI002350273A|nr:hypothetical protein [Aureisphaera galaxeae]MDC8004819.1 hypothetical protein [Aureisphaera galaxeae]